MYLGEVSVSQDDLDSFLSVAQDLCIKGLTQNESNANHQANAGPSHPPQNVRIKSQPGPSTSFSNTPPPAKKARLHTMPPAPKNGAQEPSQMAMHNIPPKREPKVEKFEDQDAEEIEVLDDDDPSNLEGYEDYYEAGPSEGGSDSKGKEGLLFFGFKVENLGLKTQTKKTSPHLLRHSSTRKKKSPN